MFVYQDKSGNICVTFTDNKPVAAPEYVIAIDEAAKKLCMVSGTIEAKVEEPVADDEGTDDVVEETPETTETEEAE